MLNRVGVSDLLGRESGEQPLAQRRRAVEGDRKLSWAVAVTATVFEQRHEAASPLAQALDAFSARPVATAMAFANAGASAGLGR